MIILIVLKMLPVMLIIIFGVVFKVRDRYWNLAKSSEFKVELYI